MKILIMILTLLTLAVFTACGGEDEYEAYDAVEYEADVNADNGVTEPDIDGEPDPEGNEATAVIPAVAEMPNWLAINILDDFDYANERERMWATDIAQFRRYVFSIHPKFRNPAIRYQPRNIAMGHAFDEHLATLIGNLPYMHDDFEIVVAIQRATAVFQDNHFAFEGFMSMVRAYRFPLEFGWLSDGFYLLRSHTDFTAFLNSRLVAINGVSTEILLDETARLIGVENVYDARHVFTRFAQSPVFLRELTAASSNEIILTFDNGGVPMELALNNSDAVSIASYDEWRALLHSLVYSLQGDMPLFLQNRAEWFWYNFIEEYGILYLRFTAFDPFDSTMLAAVSEVFATYNVRAAIMDARGNDGGNHNNAPFHLLENHVPPDMLFYFIDKSVSAALLAGTRMESMGATIVGQPSGQSLNFYVFEVAHFSPLRYSRYEFIIPTRFVDARVTHGLTRDFPDDIFRPHVLIEHTIDDWINSHDPLLEYVKSLVNANN